MLNNPCEQHHSEPEGTASRVSFAAACVGFNSCGGKILLGAPPKAPENHTREREISLRLANLPLASHMKEKLHHELVGGVWPELCVTCATQSAQNSTSSAGGAEFIAHA